MAAEISEKATESGPSGRASSRGSNGDSTEFDTVPPKEKPSPLQVDLENVDSKVIQPPKEETDNDPFKHLPPNEAEILRRQVFTPEVKAGLAALYRYASVNDIIIIVVSAIAAIASGAALPLMTVIFGNLQGSFQNYFQGLLSYDNFLHEMTTLVLYFVYLAIGEFVCVYIATVGFIYTGEHISAKIREHYLESCMRQNIGFFDKLGAGEVTTRITADTNLIQDGLSEKVGLTLSAIATFFAAFVIGTSPLMSKFRILRLLAPG
jgi:ATP-binding cassette, subfamily B (MDR/TAP), member 1